MTFAGEFAAALSAELSAIRAAIADVSSRLGALEEAARPEPTTARSLLAAAGFAGDSLNVALGVMFAESGGYVDAVGDWWQIQEGATVKPGDTLSAFAREWKTTVQAIVDLNGIQDANKIAVGQFVRNPTFADPYRKWGPSVGLGQVRTLRDPGAWGANDRYRDIEKLRNPAYQAQAVYAISSGGTNWQPWSVYTNGRFEQYVGRDFPLLTGHPEAARWNLTGTK